MFFRLKQMGSRQYLQLVENRRDAGRTRQHVLATLGRVDQLAAEGRIDALLRSLGRYAQQVRLIDGHRAGELEAGATRMLGADLVFGRLWEETGIRQVLEDLLAGRHFAFPVERAVYLTVLHRLFESGSDRAAERWRRDVVVPGAEGLELHHLYRAMRWLGEAREQVEERLFAARRDPSTGSGEPCSPS